MGKRLCLVDRIEKQKAGSRGARVIHGINPHDNSSQNPAGPGESRAARTKLIRDVIRETSITKKPFAKSTVFTCNTGNDLSSALWWFAREYVNNASHYPPFSTYPLYLVLLVP